jgi:DNA-directed RNA polymerase subunit RPC12/RpoP
MKVASSAVNLAVTRPDLAVEYSDKNSLPATSILAGTNRKLWWKCSKPECGHEWIASGDQRVLGSGCPACSNKVVTMKNNLAVKYPELAKEYSVWNTLPASKVMATTSSKVWWKCSRPECGHEWLATCYDRVKSGHGCPACVHLVVTPRNNLAVTHPDLAKEYSPKNSLQANEVVAGTGRRLLWNCSKCGHTWEQEGAQRVIGHGCPLCANEARANAARK